MKALREMMKEEGEEEEEEENLGREWARGGELFADEIAGGDVRDAEEVREPTCVGAFSDAGAAQEHPLHVPLLRRILAQRRRAAVQVEGRRRRRVGVVVGSRRSHRRGEAPPRQQGRDG